MKNEAEIGEKIQEQITNRLGGSDTEYCNNNDSCFLQSFTHECDLSVKSLTVGCLSK